VKKSKQNLFSPFQNKSKMVRVKNKCCFVGYNSAGSSGFFNFPKKVNYKETGG
jgi:hypothetical protein